MLFIISYFEQQPQYYIRIPGNLKAYFPIILPYI
jgi:hypothetical protein